MAGLPAQIKGMAEMSPVEDLMLALLRDQLPGVQVGSLIAARQQFPFVLIRRDPNFGEWSGDPRFLDAALVVVNAFCEDPNGDEDAAILSEAVRVVIRDSVNRVVAGRGHITKQNLNSAPRRASDWATATGPVQYADLPTGVRRYEAKYEIEIRKPRNRPYPNP
jgi:hypothetical protein